MGKNFLIESLRANEASKGKKSDNYFDCNASVISYSTGFPALDYYLGYNVNVCDEEGNLVTTYPSLGITAGSYVLFIGKPSTSKTAAAVKIASNIVRPFQNGTIIHFDLTIRSIIKRLIMQIELIAGNSLEPRLPKCDNI